MTNNTTTTTANFDKFASLPIVSKAMGLNEFSKLALTKEKEDFKALQRGLKISAIVAAGYEFLQSAEGKAAAQAANIDASPVDLGMSIYHLSRSQFFAYVKCAKNADKIEDFQKFVKSEEGKKLRSAGLTEFEKFVSRKQGSNAAPKIEADIIRITTSNGKAIFNLSKGENKVEMSLPEMEKLQSILSAEIERLKGIQSVNKAKSSQAERSAKESAKKAAKVQPASIIAASA